MVNVLAKLSEFMEHTQIVSLFLTRLLEELRHSHHHSRIFVGQKYHSSVPSDSIDAVQRPQEHIGRLQTKEEDSTAKDSAIPVDDSYRENIPLQPVVH
jgi:hypothetical protein